MQLTVRLLVTGTGTNTTKLLWFASSWISNKKSSVVCGKNILDFLLGSFINELLVVSDDSLGNSLSNGIHLGGLTTTVDSDSDINISELVLEEDNRFVNLELQDFRFKEVQWRTIDTDLAGASLAVSDSSSSLLSSKGLNRLHSIININCYIDVCMNMIGQILTIVLDNNNDK